MSTQSPLAEQLRPKRLDEYVGQKHLVGEQGVIRRVIEQKQIHSMIFWGPPGVGKLHSPPHCRGTPGPFLSSVPSIPE